MLNVKILGWWKHITLHLPAGSPLLLIIYLSNISHFGSNFNYDKTWHNQLYGKEGPVVRVFVKVS
jgi:hypothetical protein